MKQTAKGKPGLESSRSISISVEAGNLEGELIIPAGANGIVLFAHGSGSGRRSPRNRFVAKVIRRTGCATLLFDLLTTAEESIDDQTGQFRFDIDLLATRLGAATDWITRDSETCAFRVGYFGASTGGAAAIVAAAQPEMKIDAVVSRGGRPDLAERALFQVRAATLLIVGERDDEVLELNREAYEQLQCEKQLTVIPRATHLFEEPGALELVAHSAATWFSTHFRI